MKRDPNKQQVRISYANDTQLPRLSEPVPVHASRASGSEPAASAVPPERAPPVLPPVDAAVVAAPLMPESKELTTPQVEPPSDATATEHERSGAAPADRNDTEPASSAGGKGAAPGKPKADIETLEQFIAYAYGRKGQRVTLKPKIERLIAQSPRLDEAALGRLQAMADGDTLLAVPRQLLLVSLELEGMPGLRAAMQTLVRDVMLRHPALADAGVQAAVRNLPEAMPAAEALATVAAYTPAAVDGKDALKPAELQALRQNAAHLLAAWLASNRGMNAEELASLLFQALWAPAARALADDNARLRALTEVEQPAGVGLACDRFRQRAIDARAAQDQALREVGGLRSQAAETDAKLAQVESELDTAAAELQALRESSAAELAALRKQQDAERMRLTHDLEQLRGRLTRRLGDSIEMLEVGLTALRNKTPRTEVMAERAEHVIDALRAEAMNLREE